MHLEPDEHSKAVERALRSARCARIAAAPFATDADGQPTQPFLAQAINNRAKNFDQLIGICRGILFDNHINDDEARGLHAFCRALSSAEPVWPFTDIIARIDPILADGIITNDERAELRAIIAEFGSTDASNTATIIPIDQPQPAPIRFPQHAFCVTGRFAFGTRAAVHAAIESLGGRCIDNVASYVHYLVIGQFASRDWIHASYGRKIEAAVELRQKQEKCGERPRIAIVSEATLRPYLAGSPR